MRPLLMIPGPIEVSDAVVAAASGPPPSHVASDLIESFSRALSAMRHVWLAAPDHQPFVIAGSGTIALEAAASNVVGPGDRVLLVNSGYFSNRMAEMLRRRGAAVEQILAATVGDVPDVEEVEAAAAVGDFTALFATHVDTSTGARVDPEALCRIANKYGLLTVFDGVCATAGETFEMAAWGADVYLTASQKAIGLPPGLALWVASPRALAARARQATEPPLSLDWESWQPIMQAYEARRPSYFSTPATPLVRALDVGLSEILAGNDDPRQATRDRVAVHARTGLAMRAAWSRLGLRRVPVRDEVAANTLSALYYPEGVGAELVAAIRAQGVIVAGGLHPAIRERYFRVGHMGISATRPADLVRTVQAVGAGLRACGATVDTEGATRDLVVALAG